MSDNFNQETQYMLIQLIVKNLAIVDSLELEFDQGLSVLTGETGAGKSILIDALGLVLGDRADSSMVRHKEPRADITACFDTREFNQVRHWLAENDLFDEDSQQECIIRRSINNNGRSRGYINGQAVPLQLLRELGEKLVNIHGQNTHQALLKSEMQRNLLDEFGKLTTLVKQCDRLYTDWKKTSKNYQELKDSSQDQAQHIELLQFQLNELKEFVPQENELAELEEEYQRLSHATQIMQSLTQMQQDLTDNESYSCQHLLSSAARDLEELQQYDSHLENINEIINNALIQVDEAATEVRHYLSDLEADPERQNEINERITEYYDLARKHHCDGPELHLKMLEIESELKHFENSDENLIELEEKITQLSEDYFQQARKLSQQREKASQDLSNQVEQHIHELGMQHAHFAIMLEPFNDSSAPLKGGLEQIHFMVSTNPGQPPGLMSKIVSGGELSRISLAIQVVTAQCSDIPTLIFDEVDVGIGGGIAEMIGAKLALLGNTAQILCVTHQPQVAAFAQQHFMVEKNVNADANSKTTSSILPLSTEQRVDELSRMLGGIKISDKTRSHAREMLNQSQNV